MVVDTDAGPRFVKLRGAAQGPLALVAEIVVAHLAEKLSLAVPERVLIDFRPGLPTDDHNDELADLLAKSQGLNLGFAFLDKAKDPDATQLDGVDADLAARIQWLDGLVLNPDRTQRNPNLMIDRGRWWLIDHGAALGFQHDWPKVSEASPRREAPKGHLFASRALPLAEWDPLLAAELDRDSIRAAVAEVPDPFLEGDGQPTARRREAYVAYLWKRLKAPRPFVP